MYLYPRSLIIVDSVFFYKLKATITPKIEQSK